MSDNLTVPRIVIAGTGGDSGKTLVSMGLAASWRRAGNSVAVFKKGPDYIDAAWLEHASGCKARNLDTYMMGEEGVLNSFLRNSRNADVCLIEGNRGLFDGADTEGTHSTAELAKLLKAPVILVLDITKVTRTAAAMVLGCLQLDPDVNLAGIILNNAAGTRHERVVRASIESITGIPVLGAIPRIKDRDLLPDRHLGLVTPQEHPDINGVAEKTAEIIDSYTDAGRIQSLAEAAPASSVDVSLPDADVSHERTVRIAYFSDSAFTFYYQDNLDALESAGAELIPVSSLESDSLPPCVGLYIGGGFPETHAERLARNTALLESVRMAAEEGLPIFAECGGLIFLCRSITFDNNTFPMAGIFPLDLGMTARPQGHGYMEVEVDAENPFFAPGDVLRGHEFHYSQISSGLEGIKSIYAVRRGTGCSQGRDGLIYKNVLASYLHLHAGGAPQWAPNFINLARD
jgi:cobyrinic acid a,c-diamide synthase